MQCIAHYYGGDLTQTGRSQILPCCLGVIRPVFECDEVAVRRECPAQPVGSQGGVGGDKQSFDAGIDLSCENIENANAAGLSVINVMANQGEFLYLPARIAGVRRILEVSLKDAITWSVRGRAWFRFRRRSGRLRGLETGRNVVRDNPGSRLRQLPDTKFDLTFPRGR